MSNNSIQVISSCQAIEDSIRNGYDFYGENRKYAEREVQKLKENNYTVETDYSIPSLLTVIFWYIKAIFDISHINWPLKRYEVTVRDFYGGRSEWFYTYKSAFNYAKIVSDLYVDVNDEVNNKTIVRVKIGGVSVFD